MLTTNVYIFLVPDEIVASSNNPSGHNDGSVVADVGTSFLGPPVTVTVAPNNSSPSDNPSFDSNGVAPLVGDGDWGSAEALEWLNTWVASDS